MSAKKDGVSLKCDDTPCGGLRRSAGARFVTLDDSSSEKEGRHVFFVINGSRLEEVPDDGMDAEDGKNSRRDGQEKTQALTNDSSGMVDLPRPDISACEGNGVVKKENEIILKRKAPADPFQMGLAAGEDCPRRRRVSSIKAEEKMRRQILMENAPIEASNKENEIESFFCGLPRRKRGSVGCILLRRKDSCRPERNPAEDRTGAEGAAMLDVPHLRKRLVAHKALQDRTNSPAKTCLKVNSRCEDAQKTVPRDGVSNGFFLNDLGFLKNKKRLRKEKRRLSSQYLRLKRRNTHFNQGYTTVSPKKKAVIDLFSCPKTFYQCVKKERAVRFDTENVVSVHNSAGDLQPILTEKNDGSSFKWEKDKEKVEIVKRVDLGCETSVDDFVFRRVDKKIES